MDSGKRIRLTAHAAGYIERRGFTVDEVETAIRTANWMPAELGSGRMECRVDVPFSAEWNGKWYHTKQVRPVFVEEPKEILVITVYTYYF